MLKKGLCLGAGLMIALSMGCGQKETGSEEEAQAIAERMQKYAVKEVAFDASAWQNNDKKLLSTLIEVARLSDEIYWLQTASKQDAVDRIRSKRADEDPLKQFVELQAGPYDRLDGDEPFMDVPEKQRVDGFYPADLTKEELEAWLEAYPEDREAFLSPYTVIRRRGPQLYAVPYNEAYKRFIVPMVNKLRYAATLSEDEGLQNYLKTVSEALVSNDYGAVKSGWVGRQNSKIDFLIGPFSTGDDHLLGVKTSFEASVDVVDSAANAQISNLTSRLGSMEENLPYPNRYKNPDVEAQTCFMVVSDVFRGGEKRVGYRQLNLNLPTDAKVCVEKGVKRTIWRNALAARLEEIILPLSARLLDAEQAKDVSVDGFYRYVLLREITQNLGPDKVYGQEKSIDSALDEHYAWVEHAKADVASLYSLGYLQSSGQVTQKQAREITVSYLGRLFQTIRLAGDEPQSQAATVVLNYLLEYNAVQYNRAAKTYAIHFDRIDLALALLTNELLVLQAEGDFASAQKMQFQYGTLPDYVQNSLQSVSDLPLVVAPLYQVIWN